MLTVKKDGFVLDYPVTSSTSSTSEIEAWLRERRQCARLRRASSRSRRNRLIWAYADQLDRFSASGITSISFRRTSSSTGPLRSLLRARAARGAAVGRHAPPAPASRPRAPRASQGDALRALRASSIAEKFLIPYNEKLYACDLPGRSDKDAMGRFFPHADLTGHLHSQHERLRKNATYNSDVHVSRRGRDRIREGDRERGAPGWHRAWRELALCRST